MQNPWFTLKKLYFWLHFGQKFTTVQVLSEVWKTKKHPNSISVNEFWWERDKIRHAAFFATNNIKMFALANQHAMNFKIEIKTFFEYLLQRNMNMNWMTTQWLVCVTYFGLDYSNFKHLFVSVRMRLHWLFSCLNLPLFD